MRQILSPKDLAEAIGASESSIKRWVDDGRIAATLTEGGHRRITINEAIRFIRKSRAPLVQADVLGFPDIGLVADEIGDHADASDHLFKYLQAGEAQRAQALLSCLYLRGHSLAEICDGPLKEALTRIGELWRHNEAGIYIEHRATDICIQAINLIRQIFRPSRKAPIAIGAAPPGDPYIIPSLAVAGVLASQGFQTINLGPNAPFEAVMSAVRRHRPMLVWLSISTVRNTGSLVSGMKKFAEAMKRKATNLIVGGRGSHRILKNFKASHIFAGSTMTELVAFAKGLRVGKRSPAHS